MALGVGEKFDEATIGVAKVDAQRTPSGTPPRHWSFLDLNSAKSQTVNRILDWTIPDKAKIAIPRLDRFLRNERSRIDSGTVDVQLLVTEPIGPTTIWVVDNLRTKDISIERIRTRPIRNADHAVVEPEMRLVRGQLPRLHHSSVAG
jgi:hypothetical protein